MKDGINLADDSWKRIAEASGIESPKIEKKAQAEDLPPELLPDELEAYAENRSVELLQMIYNELGHMPRGAESLVLKRLVGDLELSPALRLTTAERK